MDNTFITPPDHVGFLAKKIFKADEGIIDGSIAYLAPKGGGPVTAHRHAYNHIFFVVKGEAKVEYDSEIVIIKEGDVLRVDGTRLHSVWNNLDAETVMLGFTASKL